MKLFSSILSELLNESMEETVVNPLNTSEDIFTFQVWSPENGNDMPGVLVYANLDADDIAKIKSNPETSCYVNRKNKLKPVFIHPDTIDNNEYGNPEEIEELKKTCQLISSLGKYGDINPEEVLDGAKFAFNQDETRDVKQIKQDENALWEELLDKFDTPRVQLLMVTIEKFTRLDGEDGLDHKFSRDNLIKILSQDNKRVAAGKQPATFVAKPQDWRKYNRQIKKGAIPIWLIYKKDPGTDKMDNQTLADVMTQQGHQGVTPENAKQRYKQLADNSKTYGPARAARYATLQQMALPTGYGWGSYYDVDDTEVIPGLEDRFVDPERQGFLDNIKMIPTDTSAAMLDGDNEEYGKAKNEINNLVGIDENSDEYIKRLNYTLASLYVNVNKVIKFGTVNWDELLNKQSTEEKQKQIFNMLITVGEGLIRGETAKDSSVKAKAKAVACLYLSSHRINPVYGMSQLNLFKQSADFMDNVKEEIPFKQKARQTKWGFNNFYKAVCDIVNKGINEIKDFVDKITQQPQQQPQTATGTLEEGVSKFAMMWANMFKRYDNILQDLGIDKDGNDITGINMAPEAQDLNEAKFYSLFNRMNKTRF